jgi:hypothetical protein
MQKLIVSLLTLTLASGVFAAASDPTKTLRLEANEAHKTVRLSTHEGDTPLVRCYLYQNGEAWTLDGTETASLAYSVDGWDEATNMVSIAGTVTANAYVDFQLDGDDTATNGQFYGQIQISDDSPSRSWVWSELRLEIRKSPIGSSGALTLNNPVNWNNTGPYTGTWPIVAGTNVVVESTTSNLTINSIKYTDAEALAAAIAGGCITSGVSVADNNTFTGTNTFTQTILGTASNATAVSGTAGATVVSGAALGATAIQAADLGGAAYSNASDFASAAQGTTADAALPRSGGTMTGNIDMNTNDITKARAVYTEYIGHPGGEVLPTAHTNIVMIEGGGVQVLNSSGGIAATFQADGNQLFGGILNANLANSTNLPVAGIDSGAATDGQVLTADGSGGAAFENMPDLYGGAIIDYGTTNAITVTPTFANGQWSIGFTASPTSAYTVAVATNVAPNVNLELWLYSSQTVTWDTNTTTVLSSPDTLTGTNLWVLGKQQSGKRPVVGRAF